METVQTPTTQNIIQYVTDLELQKPREPFVQTAFRGPVAADIVKEGEEQSFLSDKSLVSFVSGVSGQNRNDILNSTLLAQLAANKKVAIEDDVLGWYRVFTEVLTKIGWQVENAEINKFESKHNLVEVENVIIDILTAAFGAGSIAIITSTLNALKNMSEKNDQKILAFEKNTHSLSKGCFQVALATEENGAVAMQIGTFLLTAANDIKKILFVKIEKDRTTLEYSSRKATLNTQVYDSVRETVLQKLQQDIKDYVAEIEI
jgi:hypothetical protein